MLVACYSAGWMIMFYYNAKGQLMIFNSHTGATRASYEYADYLEGSLTNVRKMLKIVNRGRTRPLVRIAYDSGDR